MAFCKFCGNEIPDGTTCTCAGAQAAAQGDNAAAAVSGGYDPAFGGDEAAAPANGVKKLLPIIIAAVAAVVVIILLFTLFSAKSQAKSALKKYVKASYNKNGAEKVISLTVPDKIIKEYKSDNKDEYKEKIEDANDMTEDMLEDYKSIKFKEVSGVKKLKKSQLKGAEYGFNSMAEMFDLDSEDFDFKVTKGYQIKYKVEYKDEDGDKETEKYTACVVKVKGDGWKVLDDTTAEDLDEAADIAEALEEAEKDSKKKK
ncbi:MAG: hypothetical protein IJM44_04955 [Ruminococcus sp.]|nr:hypothetical protein [Ruminococcus sp.]